MAIILTLLRKDFARLRRDKATLTLTFLVPFVLIVVFSSIFNRKDGSGPSGIALAVIDQSGGPGQLLVDALKSDKTFDLVTQLEPPGQPPRPLEEADLEPLLRADKFHFALVLPADLVSSEDPGLHLKVLSNPRNEIETQMVYGLLQKTIFSHVPQLLGKSLQARAKKLLGDGRYDDFNRAIAENIAKNFGGNAHWILDRIQQGNFGLDDLVSSTTAPSPPAGADGKQPAEPTKDFLSRLVRIENHQVVGNEVKNPMLTRSVGGWAMQFLLFALTASATVLFYEKEQGLFQRLLSSPVTRAHILWSKFLYGVILGLVQLMVLFFAGQILYGIDIVHHLGLLLCVCVFAAAACASFGMLLASVAPSPEAARGMSTLVILLMSAIGGAWFPSTFMPAFLQSVSKLTLVYWAMEGFMKVLWSNAGFVEILPVLAILGGMAVAAMAIALWRFRRGAIFD